ncbi:DUF1642 domain-containing protein [Lactococcus lactis]|uniref:DUF1642 domain-containing protein n=1 Tax=Lactococcus lactis TaxID=1358 RepID=A0AAW8UGY2_9LACT|nr:DUF1642 domain-containing protein [Lactococcus lactis]MDT2881388.1 DUF1642 domain-containing protein [Lactococcus lactis]MDT2946053.1 DUF1642 domain-containing protein [Lactococcus lactis]
MTSFTNRIKPDSTELERYFLSVYTGNLWDALEKIKDWHSPEHIEKEIKRLRKINHLYKKAKGNAERLAVDRGERLNQAQDELAFLESQLQQQALPVVPKLTQKQADILNDYKNGSGSLAKYLSVEIKKRDYDYFARAWLDGYTVEKPKLFYLKAKELLVVGDYDHVEDLWLDWNKNLTPKKQDAHQFTQKELDSFYSKKYEQVEVTE